MLIKIGKTHGIIAAWNKVKNFNFKNDLNHVDQLEREVRFSLYFFRIVLF